VKKESGIHTGKPGRPKRVTILSERGEMPEQAQSPRIMSQSTESKKAKEEHERKHGAQTGDFSQGKQRGIFKDKGEGSDTAR